MTTIVKYHPSTTFRIGTILDSCSSLKVRNNNKTKTFLNHYPYTLTKGNWRNSATFKMEFSPHITKQPPTANHCHNKLNHRYRRSFLASFPINSFTDDHVIRILPYADLEPLQHPRRRSPQQQSTATSRQLLTLRSPIKTSQKFHITAVWNKKQKSLLKTWRKKYL